MDDSSEYGYLSPDSSGSSLQSFAGAPGVASDYSTKDVRDFLKIELRDKIYFDRPNVLLRVGTPEVDDGLVAGCLKRLHSSTTFLESKATLERLVAVAEKKPLHELEAENADIEESSSSGSGGKRERQMMVPLYEIFEMIRKFGNDFRPSTFEREWISTRGATLTSEGDTFSFPKISPDFTICDVWGQRKTDYKVKEDNLTWRRRAAFVELKASSQQGPKATLNTVKEIVAQSADYARLHISSRPFLLFSIGLLIFGSKFCVGIFDKDGVEFSEVYDMWENMDIFIRVTRRLCCEMTPYELGVDPNVEQLAPINEIAVACRRYAQECIPPSNRDHQRKIEQLARYPTYSITIGHDKYFTIGLPIWTSLSLTGRGTNIWLVTDSPKRIALSLAIMKSAWRRSGRVQESLIYEHIKVKGLKHDGLVDYDRGMDVCFPSGRKITAANLRNIHGNHEENTAILHRLLFKTIGRPLWEFDNFLEFFLAIRAALAAHKYLHEQGIMHRDISAGNILLSLHSDVPDSRRGFLTDLEFARIDDEELFADRKIPVPPVPTPGGKMTDPTTRTHKLWTTTKRGAPMTGTIQFMSCALLYGVVHHQHVKHEIHHDVESFVWVIYYAVLRRLGFVDRPLPDFHISSKSMIKSIQGNFRTFFGHVNPRTIWLARLSAWYPHTLFVPDLLQSLSSPLLQFFKDLALYVNVDVRAEAPAGQPYGVAKHTPLFEILDKVIAGLRQLPVYQ